MIVPHGSRKVCDRLVLILRVVPELITGREEDACPSMDVARQSVLLGIGHRQLLNVVRLGGASLREVAHDGSEAAIETCVVRHSRMVVRRASTKAHDGPSVLRFQVVKAFSSVRLVVVAVCVRCVEHSQHAIDIHDLCFFYSRASGELLIRRCVVRCNLAGLVVERIRLSLARSSVALEGTSPLQAGNGDTVPLTVPGDVSAREIVE